MSANNYKEINAEFKYKLESLIDVISNKEITEEIFNLKYFTLKNYCKLEKCTIMKGNYKKLMKILSLDKNELLYRVKVEYIKKYGTEKVEKYIAKVDRKYEKRQLNINKFAQFDKISSNAIVEQYEKLKEGKEYLIEAPTNKEGRQLYRLRFLKKYNRIYLFADENSKTSFTINDFISKKAVVKGLNA